IDVDSELWRWKDGVWEELEQSGDVPSTRTFLAEVWDPERKRLVLFGGQVGDYWSLSYNETYALDVTTGQWSQLNDGDGPSTRMHGHLLYDAQRDRYLLFGGHTDIGDGNDLWSMDPSTGEWTPIREADSFTGEALGCNGNESDVPADYVDQDLTAPERRHRGMYVLMHDNLWIYGGMHAECSDHLDDTWRYPLEDGDWTELIESRTGESCARQDADCECLCY
ncbi:MAG: kelch repeat-containing protein, partial [Myxococcota bacterium]|nr:kelch repeat-containing protein [Myxococcota bacterium]